MASNKTATVTEARRKAREAKAALDAERRDHERRVEEQTTEYYVAMGNLEDLQKQIRAERAQADTAVCALLDLGESADTVAKLTGLSIREVRRIKRETSTPQTPADTSAGPAAGSSTGANDGAEDGPDGGVGSAGETVERPVAAAS